MQKNKGGCPSCASIASRIWGSRAGRDILECGRCELLYFCRPIEQTYDYQDYYPYLADFDSSRFKWELDIRRAKYVEQLRHIRKLMPSATTLLDVGAGPGYLCAVATEQGWKSVGVEPSANARLVGEEQYGASYTDLDRVEVESVDVITCHHVLEHVDDPNAFLCLLRSKLRPGGFLILHVPNRQPLSFLLRNIVRGKTSDTNCSLYYPVHINGFNSRSLVRVVERQSFKSVSVFNVSMWSIYYDPFFLKNYYRGNRSLLAATAGVLTHAVRCAVDVVGIAFGRGDWIVGHFRAVQ